jgi:hypothetical protein
MQDIEKKGKGWFMEDWIRAVDVWLPLLGMRVSSALLGACAFVWTKTTHCKL